MRFCVLGTLEVHAEDGPVSVGGPVPRRLLSALLVDVGTVVPTDSLVDAAWGNRPPRSAKKSLQSHLARVREVLTSAGAPDPPELTRRGSGYVLAADTSTVDAAQFEGLVREARDASPLRAVELLDDALHLWRGPVPYADLQETCPPARSVRLQQLRRDAAWSRAAAQVAVGREAEAVADLETLVVDEPYQERPWELLMLALYRQGRQGDALATYQRARTVLLEGLGVEPGPGLNGRHLQVLRHDPALLTVQDGHPEEAPTPSPGVAGGRSRRWVVLGVALAVLGVGLVGGYALDMRQVAHDAADVARTATGSVAGSTTGSTTGSDTRAGAVDRFGALGRVAAAPNGRRLAEATLDGHVFTSDAASGRLLGAIDLHRPIGRVGWTADGRHLLVGLRNSPHGAPRVDTVDPVTGVVVGVGPRADPYDWTYTRRNRWLVATRDEAAPGSDPRVGANDGLVVWDPEHPSVTATIPLRAHVDDIEPCGATAVCVLQGQQVRRVHLPHGPIGPPVPVTRRTGGTRGSLDGPPPSGVGRP